MEIQMVICQIGVGLEESPIELRRSLIIKCSICGWEGFVQAAAFLSN